MTLRTVTLFLLGTVAVTPFHLHAENENGPLATPSYADKFRSMYDRVPHSRAFYGRVVDQAGEGLEGAAVEIRWESAEWMLNRTQATEKTVVKTDIRGDWHAVLKRPVGASVGNVEKEGYAYTYNKGSDSRDLINFPTTKANPVVSVLRKKEPLTFLIISPSPNSGGSPDLLFRSESMNSVSRPLDLIAWKPGSEWRESATTNADLRIDAVFNEERECWNFTYSITNGSGGIVLSDEMLYRAPADEYAPSVSVPISVKDRYCELQKYLYVRSRTPEIYSRILIKHSAYVGESPSLRVFCMVWTNPYGERNLEYDERVDSAFRLADTLRKEALEAWAAGRYPEKKEDMGRLAEETRERVMREIEEGNRRQKEWQERQRKLKEAEGTWR